MVTPSELSDVGTVEDVRLTLGNAPSDESVYAQAVISRALEAARVTVAERAADSAPDKGLREAVLTTAAYQTATSSPMSTQKEAAGVSKEVEVQEYLSRLEQSKDDALNSVARQTFQVY